MFGLPVSWIIAGVLALGAGGYILHCEAVKKDRAQIIASLEAQAKEQEKRNNERIAHDKKAKETADESANRQMASLQRTIVRLRNDRERAPSLPAAPAGSAKPDLACFSRADLDRALGNFEAGVEGLVAEGAAATIGLDTARDWAKSLPATSPR